MRKDCKFSFLTIGVKFFPLEGELWGERLFPFIQNQRGRIFVIHALRVRQRARIFRVQPEHRKSDQPLQKFNKFRDPDLRRGC